jgi:hypothetical protein
MFNGKAKQLYDCLYAMTRGAIVPAMNVRISRAALMEKAGIGAKVTLEQNLRRLIACGLISMRTIGGIQGGNEYTVYLPEEVSASTSPRTGTSHPSTPTTPSSGENLGALAPLESSGPRAGLSAEVDSTYIAPKTFIKDKDQFDDEAFAELLALLKQTSRELTGKASVPADTARWRELGELLVAELKIAAARTGLVSSVPAFLTEHLRRRLWKKDKAQLERESREAPESAVSTPVDASKCPDCGGSGWWYPEGTEKGVAKCRHANIPQ